VTGRSLELRDVAAADGSMRLAGNARVRVSGISYDVRRVRPGDLFAALDGDDFRGHEQIPAALSAGAVALLVGRDLERTVVPTLLAHNPRAALAAVSARFFDRPSDELRVIGVTGTDGKTTTVHLIEAVLASAGSGAGSITTLGVRIAGELRNDQSRLTTPEAPDVQAELRRMADCGIRWAVVEASSHGLALNRLDEIRFAVGAISNITHEHLDFHGSPLAYRRAKAALLAKAAACGGVAVVNADDPGALSALADVAPDHVIRHGIADPGAEVRAVEIVHEPWGTRFQLLTPRGRAAVRLPLPGVFNVSNALGAAACAIACGIEAEAIAQGLSSASPVPGRALPIDAGQPFSVIVDYAHTPVALRSVLTWLRASHPGGRLIVVFGSAGERDLLKRPWMGEVAIQCADYAVLTSEDPRFEDPGAIIAQIAAGAVSAGGSLGETHVCIPDRREAIQHALAEASPGDCVLLAGKGHESSILLGSAETLWNESGVARELLADLGYGVV
jgi:UDP-N-acetylmuramoyl-L-alanyl-D-glutamate--2,6-diaminopimelate ligase